MLADTPAPADPGVTGSSTETTATIADGVVLGGVAVGGMPQDTAVQALQAQFARPVVLRLGQLTLRIAPADLGVAVPAEAAVARALTVAPDTTLGLRASVDVPAVKAFVAGLADRYDRKPVDARLLLHGLKPYVTRRSPAS